MTFSPLKVHTAQESKSVKLSTIGQGHEAMHFLSASQGHMPMAKESVFSAVTGEQGVRLLFQEAGRLQLAVQAACSLS